MNNFYWLENDPLLGTILKGFINLDYRSVKKDSSEKSGDVKMKEPSPVTRYRMGDIVCLSIVAESKQVGEKQSEVISVLDRDLNLYILTVNFAEKSFESLCEVRNLNDELEIDTEWLLSNDKPQIDYESYKRDYKLFSSDTVGVVLNKEDFIVFYDLNSKAFSMVDA